MGEAKYRKAHDPNFGRVPKAAVLPFKDETFLGRPGRGIVVCPPVEVDGDRLLIKSSSLHPEELRFALLFWDKLVWPSSRAIHLGSGNDEQFLEACGIMARPDFTVSGPMSNGFAQSQFDAFKTLEAVQPGRWAISQGPNSLTVQSGLAQDDVGLSVILHRAVPIPKQDVPLEEILEFKQRRHSELEALRVHMESLVQEIEAGPDTSEETTKIAAQIELDCRDLLLVSSEWQFPVRVANLKTTFSLSPAKFGGAAFAGWAFAQQYGLIAAGASAAAAAVGTLVEVKGDIGLRGIRRPTSPYQYAYRIHSELS